MFDELPFFLWEISISNLPFSSQECLQITLRFWQDIIVSNCALVVFNRIWSFYDEGCKNSGKLSLPTGTCVVERAGGRLLFWAVPKLVKIFVPVLTKMESVFLTREAWFVPNLQTVQVSHGDVQSWDCLKIMHVYLGGSPNLAQGTL